MVLFKTENGEDYRDALRLQFHGQIDGRLRAVLLDMGRYCFRRFTLPLTITCLNRTKAENKKVGGKPYSAHLFGRGADVRTSEMNGKEIVELQKYLKDTWGDFLYVLYHDSGTGDHLHLNIKYEYRLQK